MRQRREWVYNTIWIAALVGFWMVIARPDMRAEEQHFAGPAATSATEMEAIGMAMFNWLSDQVAVQAGTPTTLPTSCLATISYDVALIPLIGHAALEALLVPMYMPALPATDAWGNPYEFRLATRDLLAPDIASVRSAGADGVFEGTAYVGGETTRPEDDQVWANGFSLRRRPYRHDTARQNRALREIRDVTTAWSSWLIDQVGIAAPEPYPFRGGFDLGDLPTVTHTEMVDMLLIPDQPNFFYTRCVPERDPWGHPYEFRLNPDLLGNPVFAMRSTGADGQFEGTVYQIGGVEADDFDRDIVSSDGVFVQFPDGAPDQRFADDFESGEEWGTWTCTVAPDA